MALGWLVLAAVLALSLARKQRIAPLWLTAAGYVVACQVPIYLMRSSRFTALELAQTLRLPTRSGRRAGIAGRGRVLRTQPPDVAVAGRVRAGTAVTAVAGSRRFVASSCYSTATFADVAGATTRLSRICRMPDADLAAAHAASSAPLLDQEVDPLVLAGSPGRRTWPATCSRCCRDRPEFSSATTQLRTLDSTGRLVDAQVTWVRAIAPGPVPQCGYLVQPDQPVRDRPRRAPAADGLDGRDQLPGQQRRLDDAVAVRGARPPGFRCIPASTGCSSDCPARGRRSGAGQHRRPVVCIAAGPVGYVLPR